MNLRDQFKGLADSLNLQVERCTEIRVIAKFGEPIKVIAEYAPKDLDAMQKLVQELK